MLNLFLEKILCVPYSQPFSQVPTNFFAFSFKDDIFYVILLAIIMGRIRAGSSTIKELSSNKMLELFPYNLCDGVGLVNVY